MSLQVPRTAKTAEAIDSVNGSTVAAYECMVYCSKLHRWQMWPCNGLCMAAQYDVNIGLPPSNLFSSQLGPDSQESL